MREVINEYLNKFDFDIRKSHDSRYVDQKCTPDIVCFLADCILNIAASHPTFTANDICNDSVKFEVVQPWLSR